MQWPTAWLVGWLVRMTNTTVCSVLLKIDRPPELPYTSAFPPPPAYQSKTAGAAQRARLLPIHCIQRGGSHRGTMDCAACPICRDKRTTSLVCASNELLDCKDHLCTGWGSNHLIYDKKSLYISAGDYYFEVLIKWKQLTWAEWKYIWGWASTLARECGCWGGCRVEHVSENWLLWINCTERKISYNFSSF